MSAPAIYEGVETTVEPPVCPECGGRGEVPTSYKFVTCPACDGTLYERGDTASLLAMVERMAAAEEAQGYPLTANQYQALDAFDPGTDLIGRKLAAEAA